MQRAAPAVLVGVLSIASAGCAVEDGERAANPLLADSMTVVQDHTAIEPDTLAVTASAGSADEEARAADDDMLQLPTLDELAALGAMLIVPVEGVSRADLRDTFAEPRGTDRVHEAIDILAPRGTPVLSATDGRLLRMFDSRPGGLMVYATDTSERFILLYGHLDRYADGLRDGMTLVRGQVIGYVGTTGNAPPDTPHLHFGILRGEPAVSWSEGLAVNPYLLLTSGSR